MRLPRHRTSHQMRRARFFEKDSVQQCAPAAEVAHAPHEQAAHMTCTASMLELDSIQPILVWLAFLEL